MCLLTRYSIFVSSAEISIFVCETALDLPLYKNLHNCFLHDPAAYLARMKTLNFEYSHICINHAGVFSEQEII